MAKLLITTLLFFSVTACSEQQSDKDDHVWKEQTDMIDKAKDVEQLVGDAALKQRQDVEQATQ